MRFNPAFLDDLRSRLTLSDVVGRKVTWDRRKSAPARGDFWAPCPFHQEKTASFHVDDRKGFYHCFGCQAKGDLFRFVQETENIGFAEAVERLAAEAGLALPEEARDPAAAAARDRRSRLYDVMEEAVRAFGRGFRGAEGAGARAYADRRGLSAETLKRFELGYAPASRGFLAGYFRERGELEEAVAAGLLIAPEGGGAPYDRFRDRLMFPIRDPQGRCIAFGGRSLSADAQAKYLNSPETELFSKGRVLYNHGPARSAAGRLGGLIVAEGYMDVIALAAAGFEHALAPLGTAITEEQLALLWRVTDEPVIALDGDKAGLRAAHRLIDLALPKLAPGRSLRFCLMPEGQDPDDLIRAGGPEAMEEALAAALPLVELLWRREVAAGPLDTPERRAGFDKRLRAALERIPDTGLRGHYAADFRDRRQALFAPPPRPERPGPSAGGGGARGWSGGRKAGGKWRGSGPGRGFARPPEGPRPETMRAAEALRGRAAAAQAVRAREATILLIAWANPAAAAEIVPDLEELALTTPDLAALLDPLLQRVLAAEDTADHAAPPPDEDAEPTPGPARWGDDPPPAELLRLPVAAAHPLARPGAPMEAVRAELAHLLRRHRALESLEAGEAEARREVAARRLDALEGFDPAGEESWLSDTARAALEAEDAAFTAPRRSVFAEHERALHATGERADGEEDEPPALPAPTRGKG